MSWLFPLIGSLIGGGVGGLSTWRQGEKEGESLKFQKNMAFMKYIYGKKHSDRMFDLEKNEALDRLGTEKRNLNTQFDLSMSDFNSSLFNQAFGIQDARIQTGSAIGESIAAEGASGARGNASNEMIRDYAARGLERGVEDQDRRNFDYLNQINTGVSIASDAIKKEEASWMPGGYRALAKKETDAYNHGLFNLEQSAYDWQIARSQPGVLDYITGIFGGMSSGFGMGKDIYSLFPGGSKTADQAADVTSASSGSRNSPWLQIFKRGREPA